MIGSFRYFLDSSTFNDCLGLEKGERGVSFKLCIRLIISIVNLITILQKKSLLHVGLLSIQKRFFTKRTISYFNYIYLT